MNKQANGDLNVEKTKQTYKKIYKEYATRNIDVPADVKAMLDKFVGYLKGTSVLDIGCAHGRDSKYLSEKGLVVTGCDLSEEFISLAKENCPDCNFFVADMRKLPFDTEIYDGLWVCASFLHIPKIDAEKTLKGFYNILKPGGILYVSVMEGEFDNLRENTQMSWSERQFSDYREEEIITINQKVGFKLLEINNTQTSWGPKFLNQYYRKA
jgi:ubiquinone/menaquinone biosynthesis C-methylase UbiE